MTQTDDRPDTLFVTLSWCSTTKQIKKTSSPELACYVDDIAHGAVLKMLHYLDTLKRDRTCIGSNDPPEQSDIATISDLDHEASDVVSKQPDNDHAVSQCNPTEPLHTILDLALGASCASDNGHSLPPNLSLRIDAVGQWEQWLRDAFCAVQQINCRTIAKEWIRTIHPNKQHDYPYNGRRPDTCPKLNDTITRPPYWPDSVAYREPDHLLKEDRVSLLVCLLMGTPYSVLPYSGASLPERIVTAESLKHCLEAKMYESKYADLRAKSDIIDQITRVRTLLEHFEAVAIAPSTIVTVPNYSLVKRAKRQGLGTDTRLYSTSDRDFSTPSTASVEPLNLEHVDKGLCPNWNSTCQPPLFDNEESIRRCHGNWQPGLISDPFTQTHINNGWPSLGYVPKNDPNPGVFDLTGYDTFASDYHTPLDIATNQTSIDTDGMHLQTSTRSTTEGSAAAKTTTVDSFVFEFDNSSMNVLDVNTVDQTVCTTCFTPKQYKKYDTGGMMWIGCACW